MATMGAATGILDLPAELVLHTSSFLNTKDLGSLRLTCKHVSDILLEPFSLEFFTRRQFMFEYESLKALVDITNGRMAKYLKKVVFGTHSRRPLHTWNTQTQLPNHWSPIPHEALLSTGVARDMIATAFAALPNLSTVGIRDYDSVGRWREGPNARWRSYGWSAGMNDQFKQEILGRVNSGEPVTRPSECQSTFPMVLLAMGVADNPKTVSIEVLLRRGCLFDESFMVFDNPLETTVSPILARLKSLILRVDAESYPALSKSPTNEVCFHLRRFLKQTTKLDHLRLNFDDTNSPQEYSHTGEFLDWLAGSAGHDSPDNHDLRLQTLELGCLRAPASTLLRVISRFSLKSLSLFKVDIECATQSQFDDDDIDAGVVTGFLRGLIKPLSMMQLESLLIGNIRQAAHTASERLNPTPVRFAHEEVTDENRAKILWSTEQSARFNSKRDGDVSQWLEKVAKTVVYFRTHKVWDPEETVSSDEGDGSDEGVEGDESDDE